MFIKLTMLIKKKIELLIINHARLPIDLKEFNSKVNLGSFETLGRTNRLNSHGISGNVRRSSHPSNGSHKPFGLESI